MTDHTPDNRRRETFDATIASPVAEPTSDVAPRSSWVRWALPAATIALAVLGVGALAAAALTPPADA
uniref:hypothetical protein n=1 Tax=uncultured Microbacterium sp. TaxID=191216 RepID=UPI0028D1BF88